MSQAATDDAQSAARVDAVKAANELVAAEYALELMEKQANNYRQTAELKDQDCASHFDHIQDLLKENKDLAATITRLQVHIFNLEHPELS